VLEVTQDSAVIFWETDESSDSVVRYGKTARVYALQAAEPALLTRHTITLTRLEPSTTYHFVVQSTDPSGNTVRSKDMTFKTLPPPDEVDPIVSIIDPGICQGTVTITATASDNTGVERVEFYLDDALMFIDYSPPYGFILDTTKFANGQYAITAKATDLRGRHAADHRTIGIANPIDVTAPEVNIYHPPDGATVSGEQKVLVLVKDDTGISQIEFLVDGKKISGYDYPTTPTEVHFDVYTPFWWDTRFLENRGYTFGVKATDEDGKTGMDTVYVYVNNPGSPPRPKLVITKHQVTRHKNYFGIDLWIENQGTALAKNIKVHDSLKAFQPVSEFNAATLVDYKAEFNASTSEANCVIADSLSLGPGQPQYYTFKAVPVLVHPNPPTPSIGDSIKLSYEGPYGAKYSETVSFTILKTTLNYPDVPIPTAHSDALKEADYLIVTNPNRIFGSMVLALLFGADIGPLWDNANDLLATMAHLAYLKNGVLGYANTYVESTLKNLITPGGDWAKKLHPNFSKPLGGYLLIVGETEIVPAWTQGGFIFDESVRISDHPYADTGGSPIADLIVGRIIGDSFAALAKPIKASIGVYEKLPGYAFDRDQALMVNDPSPGDFPEHAKDIGGILQGKGFTVQYLNARDYFQVSLLPCVYEQGDGFGVGDVMGDTAPEIIIADASAKKVYVYDKDGKKQSEFPVSWWAGRFQDGFTIGDVKGDDKEEIIMADSSANLVWVYNSTGGYVTFSFDFGAFDGLAAGDVTGDNKEEVVIASDAYDKIYVYNTDGVKLSEFYQKYDLFDLLAVGDILGDAKDEIVVADRSEDKLLILSATGNLLGSHEFKPTAEGVKWLNYIGWGSALAVGNLYPAGKEEILIAPTEHYSHILTYWWNAAESAILESGAIPFDFDSFDGLATANTLGDNMEEVFVADAPGYIRILELSNWASRIHSVLPGFTQNKDVLYYIGHGGPDWWCGIDLRSTQAVFWQKVKFSNHNPFILAATCLTGNYELGTDVKNIAESFLAQGAAVYIGATEESPFHIKEVAKKLFQNWDAFESIGSVFTEAERAVWDGTANDYWREIVWMYNLYGDPKFGAVPPFGAGKASALAAEQTPPSSLQVTIPDYVVETINGLDDVEIPGGRQWLEPGQLWIPFYSASIDYPSGCKVQDVVLTDRSGLVSASGLNIPMTPLTITPSVCEPVPYSGPVEGWFPEEVYRWQTIENPDGSTTLVITMYPFYYNPLTTDVQFYKNYSFNISYTVSKVEVTRLQTDQDAYRQGDQVVVDIGLNNAGEAQDVIINAAIKPYGSQEVVAGLLLRTLQHLTGPASFSTKWDSSGSEPGYYCVEVTLQDINGNVLDRRTKIFRLGICSGEVASLTATPAYFDIGDRINTSLVFSNTGTVNITGTAVIRVQDESGETVQEFRHDVTDLTPRNRISFDDVWDTSGAQEGTYIIVGYVSYDGMTTDPRIAVVSTSRPELRIYLPIIAKSVP